MRKALSISLISLLVSLTASAQVKFGVEAGMNASQTLSGAYAETNGRVSGFQVGATVDYQFSKHWALMSGLSFVQKGGELNQNLFVSGGNGTSFLLAAPPFDRISLKMNYIELPLKIGYSFRVSDNLILIPSIGVYGAYGFNAKSCALNALHVKGNRNFEYAPTQWKPFDGYSDPADSRSRLDKVSRWDLGGVVGVKAVISDHYTASFNYSQGIRKVQRELELRNSSFQLSVGYRF